MTQTFAARRSSTTMSIELVTESAIGAWRRRQPKSTRTWLTRSSFEAKAGSHVIAPPVGRRPARVIVVDGESPSMWSIADLPSRLVGGTYALEGDFDPDVATKLAIGWGLGCYRFDRYRGEAGKKVPKLVMPSPADAAEVRRQVEAATFARDLVNTPASDLGPPELAESARDLAKHFGARINIIDGKTLEKDFPAIHAVGRAATKPPCLIDMTWGKTDAPRVTLVGKGVCFDTGGLNLKPAQGMRLMKKDMGGSAAVLGLAHLIMDAALPVRLRVLIPAVENNVAGNAYRPGDVLRTRKGVSVEIGNTDAEGRVILADALALADEEAPDLLIDFATLTGAARVALGPDLPALFSEDEGFAAALVEAGGATEDPLWRLPLWQPYRRYIESPIADINNAGSSGFAGAITAAIFLSTFVDKATTWAHVDLFGWNDGDRPGRPRGGEGMTMRAVMATLRERYV